MTNTTLIQSSKDQLFRMLLLFFPNFKLVKLRSGDNIVVFRTKNIFSKSTKVGLLDILLYYIPNEISILRWGNYDYTSFITSRIVEILNNKKIYDISNKLEACINYLYSEFLTTKVINLYGNLNEVIVPLENGGYLKYTRAIGEHNIANESTDRIEDAKVVKGNSFFFAKRRERVIKNMQKMSYKFRTMAASIILSVMLTCAVLTTTIPVKISIAKLLSLTPFIIEHQEFPWTIIRNTS